MKKLSILLIGALAVLSVSAQRRSNVVLNVAGNANLQVSIDGTSYSLNGTASTNGRSTAMINDLSSGQHTLQLSRMGLYNRNRTDDVTTTFNLRNRYDMRINVNADGSIELIETLRLRNAGGNQVRISDVEFNRLMQNVRFQRPGEPRAIAVGNAFTNRSNYYTSAQVAQLLSLVSSEGARLQLAKQSYAYVVDPVNFGRVETLFTSSSNRDDLDLYVSNYNSSDITDANVYNGANYPTMTEATFNTLYQSIRRQYPSSIQYNSIAEAFNNPTNFFTTAQAIQLIQLQSSEASRLTLAKMAYRGIVDTYNYNQVYALFSSQSSKNELAAYVSAYQPGTVYPNPVMHSAMSDYDFNQMVQNVRSRFLPFEKMTTLTDIFNNRNNYFTSAQAKQLIELVSAEDNRLRLAKLSYGNIVDRSNFRTIYDLLNSQSSRNELDVYIAAYRD